jgi:hypothetical protein
VFFVFALVSCKVCFLGLQEIELIQRAKNIIFRIVAFINFLMFQFMYGVQ